MAATRRDARKFLVDLSLGLQLGVIGSLVGLCWFVLVSPIVGHPWWLIPNLLASHFYNSRQVYFGPGMVTVVGVALQIATSGFVGMLGGIATPAGRLSGLLTALAWYLVCALFLWKRLAPLMLASSIQPLLWPGYFLFGSVLGWHKRMRLKELESLDG